LPARVAHTTISLAAGLAGEVTLDDWLEFVGLVDDVDSGLVCVGLDGESADVFVVGGILNVFKLDRDLA
jgi:hypothetical protein